MDGACNYDSIQVAVDDFAAPSGYYNINVVLTALCLPGDVYIDAVNAAETGLNKRTGLMHYLSWST